MGPDPKCCICFPVKWGVAILTVVEAIDVLRQLSDFGVAAGIITGTYGASKLQVKGLEYAKDKVTESETFRNATTGNTNFNKENIDDIANDMKNAQKTVNTVKNWVGWGLLIMTLALLIPGIWIVYRFVMYLKESATKDKYEDRKKCVDAMTVWGLR